VKHARHTVKRL